MVKNTKIKKVTQLQDDRLPLSQEVLKRFTCSYIVRIPIIILVSSLNNRDDEAL